MIMKDKIYSSIKNNYWKNKKVLITGSNGFIGSHFVEVLIKLDTKLILINRSEINSQINIINNLNIKHYQFDILDLHKLKAVTTNLDIIINCAALDGNSEYKLKNAAKILDENIRITSNILNCAKDNHIKDVVLMSSAEIYPKNAVNPITEENDYTNNFDNIDNGYVISKRFTEIMGKLYEKQFNINIYLPRPNNIYGSRDKFNIESRVIPSLIKKYINNEPVEIWGNGKQIRSFVYVNDLIFSILCMIKTKKYQILNIDMGEQISILKLAKLIKLLTKSKSKIILQNRKLSGGVDKRVLENKKLKSIIDFEPTKLKDGLTETINWYKKTSKNIL